MNIGKLRHSFSFFSQDVCLNNNNKKMFMYLIFKLLSTARVCCEHMHGQHNCFQVFLIYRCSSVIDFERILIIIMDCLSLDRLFHVIYAVRKQRLKADNPIVMKVFILLSFCNLQCVNNSIVVLYINYIYVVIYRYPSHKNNKKAI